jgi:hypothetical protein
MRSNDKDRYRPDNAWSTGEGLVAIGLVGAAFLYAFLMIGWAARPAEDAAILLRYSANLASGHGIVWNIGEHPVEGATDFLLMATVAGLSRLGLTVESAVRWLGLASHLLTVLIVYSSIRLLQGGGRFLAAGSAAFLAVGPGVRYVEAYFGTPFFALMTAVSWACILALQLTPHSRLLGICFAFASLTVGLIRPEGVFLAVFMLAGLVAVKGWRACAIPIVTFVAVFGILGGGYFLWRWNYFGYPLPNPFYLKGGGSVYVTSLREAVKGECFMTFPFIIVYVAATAAAAVLWLRARRSLAASPLLWIGGLLVLLAVAGLFRPSKDPQSWLVFGLYSRRYATILASLAAIGLAAIAGASRVNGFANELLARRPAAMHGPLAFSPQFTLVIVPVFCFTVLWILLSNEMNYLSRFQYALLPILLMSWPGVFGELVGDGTVLHASRKPAAVRLLLAAAAVVILLFQHQRYQPHRASTNGLYDVAMLLRQYGDRGYLLATSEAGLLPFYSQWRALDTYGLNDPWIAHHGVITREYLARHRPQIIMFHASSSLAPVGGNTRTVWQRMVTVLEEFAREEGYRLAATFGEKPSDVHHYYVAADIPESDELVRKIRAIKYTWAETDTTSVNFAELQRIDTEASQPAL